MRYITLYISHGLYVTFCWQAGLEHGGIYIFCKLILILLIDGAESIITSPSLLFLLLKSWQRSAIKEVNDWALSQAMSKKLVDVQGFCYGGLLFVNRPPKDFFLDQPTR